MIVEVQQDASIRHVPPVRFRPPHFTVPTCRPIEVVAPAGRGSRECPAGALAAPAAAARRAHRGRRCRQGGSDDGEAAHWEGPFAGLVVTRYGHRVPTRAIEVVEAAHPVPDAGGREAAARILAMAEGLGADDLALCLISGGSALLTLPAPGIALADKQAVTGALLRSGAAIGEINAVRKHLSAIKGGRLGGACHPARLVSLLISDVPGDDPAVIGSGPTVPDPTTFADALAVLRKYGIDEPAAVIRHLKQGRDETPKEGDPRLAGAQTRIVATPAMALAAAADVAREAGYAPVILGDALEGEARDLARVHAALARDAAPGTILLSGGEATVTVTGEGRGGPNAEYALALALALDGAPGIFATACDTDGIDGTEDNAGALVAPDTLSRGRAAGEDAAARLAANDAYGFFAALGDLVMTGPTLTNVNDFRAILVSHSG